MNREEHSKDDTNFVRETNKIIETDNNIEKNILSKPADELDRRTFLGRTAMVGLIAGGLLGMPKLFGTGGTTAAQSCPTGCELVPYSGTARADTAKQRRINAAAYERNMIIPAHPCNGDEQLYAGQRYFASYSKGLQRAPGTDGSIYGEVDPAVYCQLLRALNSGVPADFEQVLLGYSNDCGQVNFSDEAGRLGLAAPLPPNLQRRLESPQAGYNFDLEGKDFYQLINRPSTVIGNPPAAFPPAFTFASPEEAVEIIENYWQALTRDVPFVQYDSSSLVQDAANDLTQYVRNGYYRGPVVRVFNNSIVTSRVYSRGILPGDAKGLFVSQFLMRDGIPYGAQTISSRIRSPKNSPDNDFMTNQADWLQIQTGQTPNADDVIIPGGIRYIRSGRDLAAYVQNDAIYQAYLNAALLLMTPPNPTDPVNEGGLGVPLNPNNPYRKNSTLPNRYCKQLNFVELGPSQLLSLLGEVSVRAHKAVWYQKWQVHRRLRPEEFGGRVHFNLTAGIDRLRYPINPVLNQSSVFSRIATNYGGNYFLPQAFPEGSPVHPAYGAGHATLAGAAVTILKAWFDSEQPYNNYGKFVEANADGTLLNTVANDFTITVADELNKLASNISIARNIAGVHWRSDYTESVFLGEQVAIQLLADYGFTYNEDFLGFRFRNFSGNLITVGESRQV